MSRNKVHFTCRPVCLLTLKQNWFAIAARYVVVTDYNQFTLMIRLYLEIRTWNFMLMNILKSAHNVLIDLMLPKNRNHITDRNMKSIIHNRNVKVQPHVCLNSEKCLIPVKFLFAAMSPRWSASWRKNMNSSSLICQLINEYPWVPEKPDFSFVMQVSFEA
jgi:hypothetical protein